MSELIPRKDAEIFWESDMTGTPTEKVLVTNRRLRLADPERPLRVNPVLNYSHGAMEANWLKADCRTCTPEGVFATYWLAPPDRPSLQAIKSALGQFKKIEGCDWARVMLDAIAFDPAYGIQGEED